MKCASLTILMLPGVLGTVGCFDVHSVDDGPWVIDDFEDGDLRPADPNFGPWACYTFNPPNQECSVGLEAGNQGGKALFVDFAIVDPVDGTEQEGGAVLQTGRATVPEDWSRFSRMTFSAKLESGTLPLPGTTQMAVQLGCSSAQTDNGTGPDMLYIVQPVPFSGDWHTSTLTMTNFRSPAFDSAHVLGGPAACLARVDSVTFQVNPLLSDGQSAMGRLTVDDIYFQ